MDIWTTFKYALILTKKGSDLINYYQIINYFNINIFSQFNLLRLVYKALHKVDKKIVALKKIIEESPSPSQGVINNLNFKSKLFKFNLSSMLFWEEKDKTIMIKRHE